MIKAVRTIEQGHVRVGPTPVTDPALLVTRNMEDFVTWVDGSTRKRTIMRYNDEVSGGVGLSGSLELMAFDCSWMTLICYRGGTDCYCCIGAVVSFFSARKIMLFPWVHQVDRHRELPTRRCSWAEVECAGKLSPRSQVAGVPRNRCERSMQAGAP